MNTRLRDREKRKIKRYANVFPYVNGGVFSGSADVPVGTANETAKEKAASDEPLSSHSQANEDVGGPGRRPTLYNWLKGKTTPDTKFQKHLQTLAATAADWKEATVGSTNAGRKTQRNCIAFAIHSLDG